MTIYRKLLLRLKKLYPHCSVTVNRQPIKEGHYGLTLKHTKSKFQIIINSVLDENDACHTLTHEFAHVAAWDEFEIHKQEHGPVWGIEHSRCYQVFEQLLLELQTK